MNSTAENHQVKDGSKLYTSLTMHASLLQNKGEYIMIQKMLLIKIPLMLIFLLFIQNSYSLQNESLGSHKMYQNTLDIDPITMLFGIYFVRYGYQFDSHNELILGACYSKATTTPTLYLPYPGNVQSFAFISGYRRYIWEGLNLEYVIFSGYNLYFENNEQKNYGSFEVYNEFRLGYRFEFNIFDIPFTLNFQCPVGFPLYRSNEPKSFKILNDKDPFFYIFIPNTFIGIRF